MFTRVYKAPSGNLYGTTLTMVFIFRKYYPYWSMTTLAPSEVTGLTLIAKNVVIKCTNPN